MREFLSFLVEKKENFEKKEEKLGKGSNYSLCLRLKYQTIRQPLYQEWRFIS